jgi:hypothetical protein
VTTAATDLAALVDLFFKGMWLPDVGIVYLVLATVAANRLPGDPTWLLVIAPPIGGKSEVLHSLHRLPEYHVVDGLTVAGLLSGTISRDRSGPVECYARWAIVACSYRLLDAALRSQRCPKCVFLPPTPRLLRVLYPDAGDWRRPDPHLGRTLRPTGYRHRGDRLTGRDDGAARREVPLLPDAGSERARPVRLLPRHSVGDQVVERDPFYALGTGVVVVGEIVGTLGLTISSQRSASRRKTPWRRPTETPLFFVADELRPSRPHRDKPCVLSRGDVRFVREREPVR